MRLAAKLTGWKIDIKSASQAQQEAEAISQSQPDTYEEDENAGN